MTDSEDPSYSTTETLMRSVQDALHNAKHARTEQGRLNFIEFAMSTQGEVVRRETEEMAKG